MGAGIQALLSSADSCRAVGMVASFHCGLFQREESLLHCSMTLIPHTASHCSLLWGDSPGWSRDRPLPHALLRQHHTPPMYGGKEKLVGSGSDQQLFSRLS